VYKMRFITIISQKQHDPLVLLRSVELGESGSELRVNCAIRVNSCEVHEVNAPSPATQPQQPQPQPQPRSIVCETRSEKSDDE